MGITAILFCFIGYGGCFLDIWTTKINNSVDGISEGNARYRLPSGKADVPKLVLHKVLFIAVFQALSLILFYFSMGEDYADFCFAPMLFGGLAHLVTVFRNIDLNRKAKRARKINTEPNL